MDLSSRLGYSLALLRISVFSVMLMWTLDKFFNPGHAARIFSNFYGMEGLGSVFLLTIGLLELAIIVAFVLGIGKSITYSAVLILHAVSTFSSYRQYLDPFENLLFFAAWPMLAACLALFLLRQEDTKWSLGK